MQGLEIALEQLGVRELGLSETPGHVLAVRWIVWVRPSAANQDLQAAGRLLGQMDYFRLSEDEREALKKKPQDIARPTSSKK